MAILFGATLVLVGGTVAAATLPSSAVFWSQTHPKVAAGTARPSLAPTATTPTDNTSTAATPTATTATATTPTPTPAPAKTGRTPAAPRARSHTSITYTVMPGDTLSGIALWFKQHGYKSLYAANRSVIGSDPDLIIPGERITISNGVMTIQAPK